MAHEPGGVRACETLMSFLGPFLLVSRYTKTENVVKASIILTASKCPSLFDNDTGSFNKKSLDQNKGNSEPLLIQFATSFQFCQVAFTDWSLLALFFFLGGGCLYSPS